MPSSTLPAPLLTPPQDPHPRHVAPSSAALSSLVLNKMRGVLDVCAIKPPSFGARRHTPLPTPSLAPPGDLFSDVSSPGDRRKSYLEDIAIVTGATFVTEQLGLTLESASGRCWGEAAASPLRRVMPLFTHSRR